MLTIIGGRAEIDMTQREADLLAALVPVMDKLRLSFFCTRCQALGNNDGVRAVNGELDEKWIVECSCSLRILNRGPQSHKP
jgi:hypothetical protein